MKPRCIRAVIFDFDGTLTLPGAIDFDAMRRAVGCPPGASILGHVRSIADPALKRRAEERLHELESEAADRAQEQPGAAEVVEFLRRAGVRTGILTLNSRSSLMRSLLRLQRLSASSFDVLITRDDDCAPKPSPDGVIAVCRRLEVPPAETLVIGDYITDVEAGRAAGASTAFFDSAPLRDFPRPAADFTITALAELSAVIQPLLPAIREESREGRADNPPLRAG